MTLSPEEVVARLPQSADSEPLFPGREVWGVSELLGTNQVRPGHVVRISNGSERVTVAFRAPARQMSIWRGALFTSREKALGVWMAEHRGGPKV